ncbi:MAG: hypothetical protein ABIG84_05675 [archaeon]
MSLYLIDYTTHDEEATPSYKQGVDRLIYLPESLKKTAIDNGWIKKGPRIIEKLENYDPNDESSIQIRFKRNNDDSRSPYIIYMDQIISPTQTKESSIKPDSIYKFLELDNLKINNPKNYYTQNPLKIKKILEQHFDVDHLMAAASLSGTDSTSKGRRHIKKTPFYGTALEIIKHLPLFGETTYLYFGKNYSIESKQTYELTPEANILRMGLDKSYYNWIIKTHPVSAMNQTLRNHFSEVMHNEKKELDKIESPGKGKYDFYGHTLYLDILTHEEIRRFHKLIKSDMLLNDEHAYDSKTLEDDIIKSYRKINDYGLFDMLAEEDNPRIIYTFLLPGIESTNNPGYCWYNTKNKISINYAHTPQSMFHEIIESIAGQKYSIRMGTIFANAASNILSDEGECGTRHIFRNNGVFDSYPSDIADRTNFNRAKMLARNISLDMLDNYVTWLLEATENTGHNTFEDADPYDFLLPHREGRFFAPPNEIPESMTVINPIKYQTTNQM